MPNDKATIHGSRSDEFDIANCSGANSLAYFGKRLTKCG